MSTGLVASTVTPGSTAPDGSVTTPVMAACANAAAGTSKTTSNTAADRLANARMGIPPHMGAVSSGDQECALSHDCGDEGRNAVETFRQTGSRRYEAEIYRAVVRRTAVGGTAMRVRRANVETAHRG